MTEVTTRLVVSTDGVEVNAQKFVDAMSRAEAAQAKAVATMTGRSSMRTVIGDWEKAQSKADPIFAAQVKRQQEVERAFQAANKAVAAGIATHDQAANAVGRVAKHHDALIVAAQKGAVAQSTLSKAMGGVQGQLVALSAGAGPVGTFLAALGPWGLAASVGVAATAAGLKMASDAAHGFADEMGRLHDVAQSVGLTSTQMQALNDEAAKFALTEEKVNQTLGRLTASLDDVRRGQGELFDLLQRIDPALANEMAMTRDTASALDLLAEAYEKAGTSRQKLDRAIGGRNGAGIGLLIQELGKQGGIDAITREFERSGDAIDRNLIERVRVLKREIDDMSKDASANFASIFSEDILELQKRAAEHWRDLSRTAKSFEMSTDLKEFFKGPSLVVPEWLKNFSLWTYVPPETLAAIRLLMSGGMAAGPKPSDGGADNFNDRWGDLGIMPLPRSRPTEIIDRSGIERELNAMKGNNAAMGSPNKQRLQARKERLAA